MNISESIAVSLSIIALSGFSLYLTRHLYSLVIFVVIIGLAPLIMLIDLFSTHPDNAILEALVAITLFYSVILTIGIKFCRLLSVKFKSADSDFYRILRG